MLKGGKIGRVEGAALVLNKKDVSVFVASTQCAWFRGDLGCGLFRPKGRVQVDGAKAQ